VAGWAISIPGAVAHAFGLLWRAWRRAWLALILASAAAGASLQWATIHGWAAATPLAVAAVVLVEVAAAAALIRLALGKDTVGPRWGPDEWRILAVGVLNSLLALVLVLLLLVVIVFMAYGVAAAGRGFATVEPATWAGAVDGRGRVVIGAVATVGVGAIVWVMTRISLAPVATVARGRVQVLSTWPLARSRVLPLLAATVWVALTPAALCLLLWSVARFTYPGEFWVTAIVHLGQGLVLTGIWLPLKVGVMSYFYARTDVDSAA